MIQGLLALAWGRGAALGAVTWFLAGVGLYMLHNTLQTQATQMAPEVRGAAVTLDVCVLFLTQSIGVWLIGTTLDRGALAGSFTVCAAGLVVLGHGVSRNVGPRA